MALERTVYTQGEKETELTSNANTGAHEKPFVRIFDYRFETTSKAASQNIIEQGDISVRLNCEPQSVIIQSEIPDDLDFEKKANLIAEKFNVRVRRGKNAYYESASWFASGERLESDQFMVAERNGVPELYTHRVRTLVKNNWFNYSIKIEMKGKHKLSEKFFGSAGNYVLKVPKGKYALINENSLIFNEGIHVLVGTNIKFDPKKNFKSKSENYIHHGNTHLVNVPAGKVATVRNRDVAMILEPKSEPYIFNSSSFHFFKLLKASEPQISFKDLIRLMPPTNKTAIIKRKGIIYTVVPNAETPLPLLFSKSNNEFLGYVSMDVQNRIFPMKDANDKKEYVFFPINEKQEIGIKLHVSYQIINAPAVLSEVSITYDKLDMAIAVHIQNLFFIAVGKVLFNYLLASGNTAQSKSLDVKEFETIKAEVILMLTEQIKKENLLFTKIIFEPQIRDIMQPKDSKNHSKFFHHKPEVIILSQGNDSNELSEGSLNSPSNKGKS